MNMIVSLLSHEPFLDRVAGEIIRAAEGQAAEVSTENGAVRGTIQTFRLSGRPLFLDESCDCMGNTCSLPFSGRAEISGYGEAAAGGGWLPFSKPVEYFGQVDVSWPDGAESVPDSAFSAAYPQITVKITLESIGGAGSEARPQKPASLNTADAG